MRVGGFLVLALALLGCEPRPDQFELGTPAQRYAQKPLVLLPRTCLVRRSVPDWHFGRREPGPSPVATTVGLRRAIDTLVEPVRLDGRGFEATRTSDECEAPPDLDFRPNLGDYRASDSALQLMRDRGAESVVVLEVHTVMACAHPHGSRLLAYYAAERDADAAPSFVERDVCLEDDITVTAFLFDAEGAARWALTRAVRPGDPIEWTIDRVLDRVPVSMPKRPRSAVF